MAFYYQLFLHKLPCALCVFQRMAHSLLTFGIILNLIHGNKSQHYFLVIIVTLLNAAMVMTQILLHIVPSTGTYVDAVFSLHMYLEFYSKHHYHTLCFNLWTYCTKHS